MAKWPSKIYVFEIFTAMKWWVHLAFSITCIPNFQSCFITLELAALNDCHIAKFRNNLLSQEMACITISNGCSLLCKQPFT